jgi:uncharacterized protein (TIGR02001 family)
MACQRIVDSSDSCGLRDALRETLYVTRHIRPLLLIALAGCGLARADTVRVFTGSLGGTSDFVFRGLSLTRGKPAAQASIDIEFPREFYVGAFLAMADPNPGPSPVVEIDAWAGRYWRIGEHWSSDLRLSQYTYPDDPRRVTYDRTEITGTVGFHNQLFIAAIYSPNTEAVASAPGYERDGQTWALELSGRQQINERWALSAGFGHYDLQEVYHDNYNYWNVTVTATLRPFELQLAYLGIEDSVAQHFPNSDVGDRVALTVLWRFSTTN